MLLERTPEGFDNKGLDIEFTVDVTERLYQVREIRRNSFIETAAFILGSIAGLVFVARVVKNWLGDKEYFRAKDRECDMLFGSSRRIDIEREKEFKQQVELAEARNK